MSTKTASKTPSKTAPQKPQVVPDPPRQDNQHLDDENAVVCPVCQYRFEPGAEVL